MSTIIYRTRTHDLVCDSWTRLTTRPLPLGYDCAIWTCPWVNLHLYIIDLILWMTFAFISLNRLTFSYTWSSSLYFWPSAESGKIQINFNFRQQSQNNFKVHYEKFQTVLPTKLRKAKFAIDFNGNLCHLEMLRLLQFKIQTISLSSEISLVMAVEIKTFDKLRSGLNSFPEELL